MNTIQNALQELCELAPDWFRLTERRGVFSTAFEIRNVNSHTAKHTWQTIAFEDGSAYPNLVTQCVWLIVTLLALCDSRGWSTSVVFHPQLERDFTGQATINHGSSFQNHCADSRIEALITCVVGTLSAPSNQPP